MMIDTSSKGDGFRLNTSIEYSVPSLKRYIGGVCVVC